VLNNYELADIESLLGATRPDGTPVAAPEERAYLQSLLAAQHRFEAERPWAKYRADPVGYCRDVLDMWLTPHQERIFRSALEPPYRVHVDSGHSLGKTAAAGALINWRHDNFDPGVIMSVAPTFKSVVDVLWGEVRLQRQRARKKFPNYPMDFIGPRAPEMRTSENHWAIGITADRAEALHGRHHDYMTFVYDESEALDAMYYTIAASMFQPNGRHIWLSICNPTTRSSAAYLETLKTKPDGTPLWTVIRLSTLDHPNVRAELEGRPPPIPPAITLGHIEEMIHQYRCERVPEDEAPLVTDFKFPPDTPCPCRRDDAPADPRCPKCFGSGSVDHGGVWYRPGPEAEPRILGRRPTVGSSGVWNEALWESCEKLEIAFPWHEPPEIGCDVARVLGGDDCDIHVRWGGVSLHHESANGRPIPATAGRLKQLCAEYAEYANKRRPKDVEPFYPHKIPVKIDDGAAGGGVVDLAGGYNFIPVNAASSSTMDLKYPRLRDELWFETAERARLGGLSLKLLPVEWREKLRVQALSPEWSMDSRGRRVVEPKERTKSRLGRSPDCFVAGTLVMTEFGNQPIEEVNIGTMVWTRFGWCDVVGRGMTEFECETIRVEFSDGSVLTGSRNHPVWENNNGWTSLGDLKPNDTVQTCRWSKTSSSTTGSLSSATPAARACPPADIITHTRMVAGCGGLAPCTGSSGSRSMGRSRRGMKSTTRTRTSSTTTFLTWNALRPRLTPRSIISESLRQQNWQTWIGYVLSLSNGTQALKGGSGTPITPRKCTSQGNPSTACASSAASHTRVSQGGRTTSSVGPSAHNGGTTGRSLSGSTVYANCATRRSSSRPEGFVADALARVRRVSSGPSAAVFNLTVSGAHEFYANGVLVHNCLDAFNLSYLKYHAAAAHWVDDGEQRAGRPGYTQGARVGLLGRGPNAGERREDRDEEREEESPKFRTLGRGFRR